jgi:hypothetical protein
MAQEVLMDDCCTTASFTKEWAGVLVPTLVAGKRDANLDLLADTLGDLLPCSRPRAALEPPQNRPTASACEIKSM